MTIRALPIQRFRRDTYLGPSNVNGRVSAWSVSQGRTLRIRDVGALLGVSHQVADQMFHEGKLPKPEKVDGRYRTATNACGQPYSLQIRWNVSQARPALAGRDLPTVPHRPYVSVGSLT